MAASVSRFDELKASRLITGSSWFDTASWRPTLTRSGRSSFGCNLVDPEPAASRSAVTGGSKQPRLDNASSLCEENSLKVERCRRFLLSRSSINRTNIHCYVHKTSSFYFFQITSSQIDHILSVFISLRLFITTQL